MKPQQPQQPEKITPQEEIAQLKEQVAASPEKAKDIVSMHLERKAETVYKPGFVVSPQKLAEIEKHIIDPHYKEVERAMEKLFTIVEDKGVLNAVKVAQKLPVALQDEFHDRLVKFLHENAIE